MKSIVLTLLLVWLSHIDAADINETIVDGNRTLYLQLLRALPAKGENETHSLERSLLKKLSDTHHNTQTHIEKTLPLPTDRKMYGDYFKTYLEDAAKIFLLQKRLEQTQRKIETIESEIKKLDDNDTRLLSFELQDAFYIKNRTLYQKQIDLHKKRMQQIADALLTTLPTISFDNSEALNTLQKTRQEVQKLHNQIDRLAIDKEQAELIGSSAEAGKIAKQITKLKSRYHQLSEALLEAKFLLFASALKRQDESAFSWEQKIRNQLAQMHDIAPVDATLLSLFQKMERKYLGQIKTLAGSSRQEIMDMLHSGWEIVTEPIFHINKTPVSIFKLTMTLLVFIVGFLFGGLYKRKINRLAARRKSFTPATRTLMANLGYYLIILIAFFMALNVLGIKLSSIALVAGALSVGIGFGLQNIVSNLVSGLILMFERTIRIGDYVEISDTLRGYVTDIRMRSTTINTNENIDIIVPNQNFIQNNVINWTMNDKIRRFEIPFGVKYGTKPEKVIEVIKNAVDNSGYGDIYTSADRHTRVIMTEMGDSSVNFEPFVWIVGNEIRYPKRTTSRFLILIYNALYENDIEIPFPQQDLHIRSVEAPFTVITRPL